MLSEPPIVWRFCCRSGYSGAWIECQPFDFDAVLVGDIYIYIHTKHTYIYTHYIHTHTYIIYIYLRLPPATEFLLFHFFLLFQADGAFFCSRALFVFSSFFPVLLLYMFLFILWCVISQGSIIKNTWARLATVNFLHLITNLWEITRFQYWNQNLHT